MLQAELSTTPLTEAEYRTWRFTCRLLMDVEYDTPRARWLREPRVAELISDTLTFALEEAQAGRWTAGQAASFMLWLERGAPRLAYPFKRLRG